MYSRESHLADNDQTDFIVIGGIAKQSDFSGPDLSDKISGPIRSLFVCDVRTRARFCVVVQSWRGDL